MWFEQVMNWLDGFFNKPLPIIGVSLGIICILVFKLLAKSSFGKKKYAEMKEKVAQCDVKLKESNKLVEKIEKESNSKIKALEAYYETKLAQKQAKEDLLEDYFIKICDNIHNEKVKNLVLEYKGKTESTTTIMTDKINEVKASYESRIQDLENIVYGKEKHDSDTEEESLQ